MWRVVVAVVALVVAARAPCPSSRTDALGGRGWKVGASGVVRPGSEDDVEEEEDYEEDDYEEEDDWEDTDELLEDPMGEAFKQYYEAKREGLM